jgi:hypothetical protein
MFGFNAPPVIPGPDGARRPKDPPPCDACRASQGVTRVPMNVGGEVIMLCLDAANCNERSRAGVTLEQWLADMQAETAAWSPLTYPVGVPA